MFTRQQSSALAIVFLATMISPTFAQLEVATNYTSGSSQTNQFNLGSGYISSGSSLDGQPITAPAPNQWQTTDPFNPGTGLGSTSLVAFIPNYSPLTSPSGNNSVYFGGYGSDFFPDQVLPGSTNPSLYYSFTQSGVFGSPALLRSSTFSVDFSIIGPSSDLSPGYTNKDYFGFNLLDSTGTNSLARIRFNPFTAFGLTNGLRLEWYQNGTNVVADGSTFKTFQIEYDALYRLTATISNQGGGSPSSLFLSIAGLQTQTGPGVGITNYAVVTNQTVITGGALSSSFTTSDFARASVDWELSSGNISTPGANYMIMTAASIISQAVPEPGTWAMAVILLGGAGAMLARRRWSAKAVE